MSIELFVISLFLVSLAIYLISALNKVIGSYMTVISSVGAFAALFLFKDSLAANSTFLGLGFEVKPLGLFFSLIILFIYANVSFFNPYWIKKFVHPATYNMLYVLSMAGTVGLFFAKDFISLFIFFETVVWTSMFIIPMGKSRTASVVYYVVSVIGTFALLFGSLLIYEKFNTLNITEGLSLLSSDPTTALIVYVLFGIAAFAKIGAFPLHIWLPLAHGNAPDTFSPVLSGGLVKMGAYISMLMTLGLKTTAVFADMPSIAGVSLPSTIVMLLASVSIIVGTLMAIREDDAKKLIAYSSVANGGYILVGIAIADNVAVSGAMFHILAHAIASAAAFMAIAAVSRNTGTTKISELGGIIHKMPVTFMVYLIAIISMAGIPPMGGFISKWLIFQSLFQHGFIFVSIAAFIGSIGSFLYVFRILAGLFLGQELPKYKSIKEAPVLMLLPMSVLSLATVYTGIFPNYFLRTINVVLEQFSLNALKLEGFKIIGYNGVLNPALIAGIFCIGVAIAFLMFIALPKSRKVDLMDTYTAGEFIYTPELLHYSADFYAPLERLYANRPDFLKLYSDLINKLVELGRLVKYIFFGYKPGITALWIVLIITFALWGELL